MTFFLLFLDILQFDIFFSKNQSEKSFHSADKSSLKSSPAIDVVVCKFSWCCFSFCYSNGDKHLLLLELSSWVWTSSMWFAYELLFAGERFSPPLQMTSRILNLSLSCLASSVGSNLVPPVFYIRSPNKMFLNSSESYFFNTRIGSSSFDCRYCMTWSYRSEPIFFFKNSPMRCTLLAEVADYYWFCADLRLPF